MIDMMKKLLIASILLAIVSPAFALTEKSLRSVIECKSQYDDMMELSEENLQKLGWKKKQQSNMWMYVYESKEEHTFFGHSTHLIASTSTGMLALFEPSLLNTFIKKYEIKEDKTFKWSYYRGLRTLEKRTDVWPSYVKNLNVSELVNQEDDTAYTAIGCSFDDIR